MEKRSKREGFVRTTVYLPAELYSSAKMMAVLTGRPVSFIMRIALADKIKELKNQAGLKGNPS